MIFLFIILLSNLYSSNPFIAMGVTKEEIERVNLLGAVWNALHPDERLEPFSTDPNHLLSLMITAGFTGDTVRSRQRLIQTRLNIKAEDTNRLESKLSQTTTGDTDFHILDEECSDADADEGVSQHIALSGAVMPQLQRIKHDLDLEDPLRVLIPDVETKEKKCFSGCCPINLRKFFNCFRRKTTPSE